MRTAPLAFLSAPILRALPGLVCLPAVAGLSTPSAGPAPSAVPDLPRAEAARLRVIQTLPPAGPGPLALVGGAGRCRLQVTAAEGAFLRPLWRILDGPGSGALLPDGEATAWFVPAPVQAPTVVRLQVTDDLDRAENPCHLDITVLPPPPGAAPAVAAPPAPDTRAHPYPLYVREPGLGLAWSPAWPFQGGLGPDPYRPCGWLAGTADGFLTVAPDRVVSLNEERFPLALATLPGDGQGREGRALFAEGDCLDVPHAQVLSLGVDGRIQVLAGLTQAEAEAAFPEGPAPVEGPCRQVRFGLIPALALDPDGTVWVADQTLRAIRRIDPQGWVTTLAGGGPGPARDGRGAQAAFSDVMGMVLAPDRQSLYVSDRHAIRRVSLAGEVSTVAGSHGLAGCQDAAPGSAPEDARLDRPGGLAFHRGRLILADVGNRALRSHDPATGALRTLMTGLDLPATQGLAVDAAGTCLVVRGDRLHRLDLDALLEWAEPVPPREGKRPRRL